MERGLAKTYKYCYGNVLWNVQQEESGYVKIFYSLRFYNDN